jgi:hypothetical protein
LVHADFPPLFALHNRKLSFRRVSPLLGATRTT